jgi:hypothetical protein
MSILLLKDQDRIEDNRDIDDCSRCYKKGKKRKGKLCYQVVAEGSDTLGAKVKIAFSTRLCGYCYPVVSRKLDAEGQPPLRMGSKLLQDTVDRTPWNCWEFLQ